jgi:hypothetical protein
MIKEKKMKKLFAILAVLSLLMVPCVSMASTMTDSELADVTGQMGVTILVGNLTLGVSMSEILWGDADGFSDASFAGYVNMITPINYTTTPFTMHVGVSSLAMTIDVGTYDSGIYNGKTAVKIGLSNMVVTVDAIAFVIFLNADKGADWDYASSPGGSFNYTANQAGYYQNSKLNALVSSSKGGAFVDGAAGNSSIATDCLGLFGVSHLRVSINALDLLIMAH